MPPATHASSESHENSNVRQAGARVLVVDDDRSIRELIAELARDAGHEAVCVGSFEEFQRRFDSDYDLVLLDLHMPDVDGVELLRFVAKAPSVPRIAVMSGFGHRIIRTVEELVKVQGLSIAGSLAKPFSARQLLELFDESRDAGPPSKIRLKPQVSVAQLEEALNEEQLSLYYQPKVRIRDGAWLGVEALVRWQLPNGQWIAPDCFIPVAEENGLISRLTDFVLRRALRDCARLRDEGTHLEFAINISMRDLEDLELPSKVEHLAEEAALNLAELQLEVTESGLMRDQVGALDTLSRLCLKGAKISIDDFGTGYASLQRLSHMPFDEMKIDISFIQRALADEKSRIIVENSLALARRLHMRSVAEGIENEAIWRWLGGLGCDYAQGYWIGRPMPFESLQAWHQEWRKRLRLLQQTQPPDHEARS